MSSAIGSSRHASPETFVRWPHWSDHRFATVVNKRVPDKWASRQRGRNARLSAAPTRTQPDLPRQYDHIDQNRADVLDPPQGDTGKGVPVLSNGAI